MENQCVGAHFLTYAHPFCGAQSGRVTDPASGRYTDDVLNGSRRRVFGVTPASPRGLSPRGSLGNNGKSSARGSNGKANPGPIMERAFRAMMLESGEVKLFFDFCSSRYHSSTFSIFNVHKTIGLPRPWALCVLFGLPRP